MRVEASLFLMLVSVRDSAQSKMDAKKRGLPDIDSVSTLYEWQIWAPAKSRNSTVTTIELEFDSEIVYTIALFRSFSCSRLKVLSPKWTNKSTVGL